MDHERDARGRRRWLWIGGVLGGITGLVLGIGAVADGESPAVLLTCPSFACMGAAVGALLRLGGPYSPPDDVREASWPDRRTWIARNIGTALVLMAGGVGFFVLTGSSQLL